MSAARPMDTDGAQPVQSHLEVISRLQGLIDAALAPSLPALRSGPYALLDVPDYGNVGDSAIWAGEVAWLKRNVGTQPQFVCDLHEPMERVKANVGGCSLLLQGGGNFGDVWPVHQEFRESIILDHPQSHVIQFPQSIHFSDDAALQRTAAKLTNTPNLRLLVRDHESFDLAMANFGCEVAMSPDMAFALGPLERTGSPDLDVLLVLRTDKESVGEASDKTSWPNGWEQADWLEDDANLHGDVLRDTRVSALRSLNPGKMSKRARRNYFYNELADRRVQRGVRLLSRAKFIITDRLHVHILSTLLGLPHCFLDNHYGKISRFSAAFSTRWKDCHQAKTLPEAVGIAQSWLDATRNRKD